MAREDMEHQTQDPESSLAMDKRERSPSVADEHATIDAKRRRRIAISGNTGGAAQSLLAVEVMASRVAPQPLTFRRRLSEWRRRDAEGGGREIDDYDHGKMLKDMLDAMKIGPADALGVKYADRDGTERHIPIREPNDVAILLHHIYFGELEFDPTVRCPLLVFSAMRGSAGGERIPEERQQPAPSAPACDDAEGRPALKGGPALDEPSDATPGAADDPAPPADAPDPTPPIAQDAQDMVGSWKNADFDDTTLKEACRFLNVQFAGQETRCKLKGTKLVINWYQILGAYLTLKRCYGSGGHNINGVIVAHEAGLGKTRQVLATLQIMRMIRKRASGVWREWQRDEDEKQGQSAGGERRHNRRGEPGACPSGDPSCFCSGDPVTIGTAFGATGKPIMLMVPPSLSSNWMAEVDRYFEGGRDGHFQFIDIEKEGSVPQHAIADVVGEGNRPDQPVDYEWAQNKKHGKQEKEPDGGWDLREHLEGWQLDYSREKMAELKKRQLVVVCSNNSTWLKNRGASTFRGKYSLKNPKRAKPVSVRADWAVVFDMRIIDEFHQFKTKDTGPYSTDRMVRLHTALPTKIIFISGTPVSVNIKGISEPLRAILPPERDITVNGDQKHLLWRQSHAYFMEKIAPLVNGMANTGTTDDNPEIGRVCVLRDGQKLFQKVLLGISQKTAGLDSLIPTLREEVIPCRSQQADTAAYKQRIGHLKALLQVETRDKKGGTESVQFCQAFQAMMLIEVFPGILGLPDELAADLSWFTAERVSAAAKGTAEGDSPILEHAKTIASDCAAFREMCAAIQRYAADQLKRLDGRGPFKNHVAVITTRPGIAFVLREAARLAGMDRDWQLELMLADSWAVGERKEKIDSIFPEIGVKDEQRPTLLFAPCRIIGTGFNGLEKVALAVLVGLPFSEAETEQLKRRFHRLGLQHQMRLITLVPGEIAQAVMDRHTKRSEAFKRLVGTKDSGTQGTGKQ